MRQILIVNIDMQQNTSVPQNHLISILDQWFAQFFGTDSLAGVEVRAREETAGWSDGHETKLDVRLKD